MLPASVVISGTDVIDDV